MFEVKNKNISAIKRFNGFRFKFIFSVQFIFDLKNHNKEKKILFYLLCDNSEFLVLFQVQ